MANDPVHRIQRPGLGDVLVPKRGDGLLDLRIGAQRLGIACFGRAQADLDPAHDGADHAEIPGIGQRPQRGVDRHRAGFHVHVEMTGQRQRIALERIAFHARDGQQTAAAGIVDDGFVAVEADHRIEQIEVVAMLTAPRALYRGLDQQMPGGAQSDVAHPENLQPARFGQHFDVGRIQDHRRRVGAQPALVSEGVFDQCIELGLHPHLPVDIAEQGCTIARGAHADQVDRDPPERMLQSGAVLAAGRLSQRCRPQLRQARLDRRHRVALGIRLQHIPVALARRIHRPDRGAASEEQRRGGQHGRHHAA